MDVDEPFDPDIGLDLPAETPDLAAIVVFTGVDIQRRALQTTMYFQMGDYLRQSVIFQITGVLPDTALSSKEARVAVMKLEAAASQQLTLLGPTRSEDVVISLGDLFGIAANPTPDRLPSFRFGLAQVTQEFTLVGAAEKYPDDAYVARIPARSALEGSSMFLPLKFYFRRSANLSTNFELSVATPITGTNYIVNVSRGNSFRRLIYLLCLAPLILIMLVPTAAVLPGFGETSPTSIVALLAPVILSILPLRLVLVPSEVTGFARVDTVLALELLFITFIGVLLYAIKAWARASVRTALPANAPKTTG